VTGRIRRRWLDDGAWVLFCPGWLADSAGLLREIEELDRFRQEHLVLYGRRVAQPRLTAWYGVEMDIAGRYRAARDLHPFTPRIAGMAADLSALRDEADAACGTPYNSVLVNWYRSGADSVSWHADDEPTLGPDPVIASVTLGASRRFVLKPRDGGPRLALSLGDGDLLVMGGDIQRRWLHAVPKQPSVQSRRINLTFRHYLVDTSPIAQLD
jgi:alkylated DNA repair dioxygenase AlkB